MDGQDHSSSIFDGQHKQQEARLNKLPTRLQKRAPALPPLDPSCNWKFRDGNSNAESSQDREPIPLLSPLIITTPPPSPVMTLVEKSKDQEKLGENGKGSDQDDEEHKETSSLLSFLQSQCVLVDHTQ
ncbi:hypothetical protein Scep_005430 [Stephania cephalantha]|uniref:Uncharacterized protein n=1 Tax=Stephania cephalantha TaxID=152367 RepID=A0AAP0KUA2_9MAGN